MKRFLHLISAAAVAAAITIGVAPSQAKSEAVMLAGLWSLARPAPSVTRDFYFDQKLWLADAHSFAAALRFLWDLRQTGAVHDPAPTNLASGARPLILIPVTDSNALTQNVLVEARGQQPGVGVREL